MALFNEENLDMDKPSSRKKELYEKQERFMQYYQNLNRSYRENILRRVYSMKEFFSFLSKDPIILYEEYPTSGWEEMYMMPVYFTPICFYITEEGILRQIVAVDPENIASTHFSKSEIEEISIPISDLGVTSTDDKNSKAGKILESNEILIRDDINQEWGDFLMVFNVDINDTK